MDCKLLQGDALTVLKTLPSESIDSVVTSPPYWALRDYNVEGQLGLEPTFQEYVTKLCDIFDEVKRVLKKEGTCWVNIGDTYGGSGNSSGHTEETTNCGKKTEEYGASKGNQNATKGMEKCLCQIPSRFAIEMTNRGWILRNRLIWHKPNCIYPEKLIEPMISAGCRKGQTVLDPFSGAGTTGLVAIKQGKNYIGIELNSKYIEITNKRLLPFLEQTTLGANSVVLRNE